MSQQKVRLPVRQGGGGGTGDFGFDVLLLLVEGVELAAVLRDLGFGLLDLTVKFSQLGLQFVNGALLFVGTVLQDPGVVFGSILGITFSAGLVDGDVGPAEGVGVVTAVLLEGSVGFECLLEVSGLFNGRAPRLGKGVALVGVSAPAGCWTGACWDGDR